MTALPESGEIDDDILKTEATMDQDTQPERRGFRAARAVEGTKNDS